MARPNGSGRKGKKRIKRRNPHSLALTSPLFTPKVIPDKRKEQARRGARKTARRTVEYEA